VAVISVRTPVCVAFSLSLLLIDLSAAAQAGQWSSIDGRWWLGSSSVEHDGFILGFLDCYNSSSQKKLHTSWRGFQLDSMVRRYIAADSGRLISPMWKLLPLVIKSAGVGPYVEIDKGGETNAIDWYFWGEYASGPDGPARGAGAIEGYLSCNESVLKGRRGRYSRAAADYVTLITRWYGYDPKTFAHSGPLRDDVLVWDVLYELRDPSK
jgi:hypothetical protein